MMITLDTSGPKKQTEKFILFSAKLTGKRKVIGRNFVESAKAHRLRGNNQLAKGQRKMDAYLSSLFFSFFTRATSQIQASLHLATAAITIEIRKACFYSYKRLRFVEDESKK